jgi:hypothetical protein
LILKGRIGRAEDKGAQARFGERYLLVNGAEPRTFGVENGVDKVGVNQSFFDRLGASRTAENA